VHKAAVDRTSALGPGCVKTPAQFPEPASSPNARVSAAVGLLDRGYGRPSTAVFVEMTQQVSSADREALLTTVVTAMDEMAASTKAAEKRAAEAEQRVSELERLAVGGTSIVAT
jgi:hypothetical protein